MKKQLSKGSRIGLAVCLAASMGAAPLKAAELGWQKKDGKWYYVSEEGNVTNWFKDGNCWYFFGNDGAMETGWHASSDAWYYLGATSGVMQGNGFIEIDGNTYYLYDNGAMATDTLIDGKEVLANGIVIPFVEGKSVQYRGQDLKGQVIEGNLYITSSEAVVLEGVTVKGKIVVEDGTKVTIKDSNIKEIVVNDKDTVIEIGKDATVEKATLNRQSRLEGKGEVKEVVLSTLAKDTLIDVKVDKLSVNTFEKVEINQPVKEINVVNTSELVLNNNVEKITVNPTAKGSDITIAKDVVVNEVVAKAPLTIKGEGNIAKLVVESKDVVIDSMVGNIEVKGNGELPTTSTGDEVVTDKPAAGGGGGGGAGGSGGGNQPTEPEKTETTVNSQEELKTALADSKIKTINVKEGSTIKVDTAITVPQGVALNVPETAKVEISTSIKNSYIEIAGTLNNEGIVTAANESYRSRIIDETSRLYTVNEGVFYSSGELFADSYYQLVKGDVSKDLILGENARININREDIVGGDSGIELLKNNNVDFDKIGENPNLVALFLINGDGSAMLRIHQNLNVTKQLKISVFNDFSVNSSISNIFVKNWDCFSENQEIAFGLNLGVEQFKIGNELIVGEREDNPAILRDKSGNLSINHERVILVGKATLFKNIGKYGYYGQSFAHPPYHASIVTIEDGCQVMLNQQMYSKGTYGVVKVDGKDVWEERRKEINKFEVSMYPYIDQYLSYKLDPGYNQPFVKLKIEVLDSKDKVMSSVEVETYRELHINESLLGIPNEELVGKRLRYSIIVPDDLVLSDELKKGVITNPISENPTVTDEKSLLDAIFDGNKEVDLTIPIELGVKETNGRLSAGTVLNIMSELTISNHNLVILGTLNLHENGKIVLNPTTENYAGLNFKYTGNLVKDDKEMIGKEGEFIQFLNDSNLDEIQLSVKNNNEKICFIVPKKSRIALLSKLQENAGLVGEKGATLVLHKDDLYDNLPAGTYQWNGEKWIAGEFEERIEVSSVENIASAFERTNHVILKAENVETESEIVVPFDKKLEVNGNLSLKGISKLIINGELVMNGELNVETLEQIFNCSENNESLIRTEKGFKLLVNNLVYFETGRGRIRFDNLDGGTSLFFQDIENLKLEHILEEDYGLFIGKSNAEISNMIQNVARINVFDSIVKYRDVVIINDVEVPTDDSVLSYRAKDDKGDRVFIEIKNGQLQITVRAKGDRYPTSTAYFNGKELIDETILVFNPATQSLEIKREETTKKTVATQEELIEAINNQKINEINVKENTTIEINQAIIIREGTELHVPKSSTLEISTTNESSSIKVEGKLINYGTVKSLSGADARVDENLRLHTFKNGMILNHSNMEFDSISQLCDVQEERQAMGLYENSSMIINGKALVGNQAGITFEHLKSSDSLYPPATIYFNENDSIFLMIEEKAIISKESEMFIAILNNSEVEISKDLDFDQCYISVDTSARKVKLGDEVVLGEENENPAIIRGEKTAQKNELVLSRNGKIDISGKLKINRNVGDTVYSSKKTSVVNGNVVEVMNDGLKFAQGKELEDIVSLRKGKYNYNETTYQWEAINSEETEITVSSQEELKEAVANSKIKTINVNEGAIIKVDSAIIIPQGVALNVPETATIEISTNSENSYLRIDGELINKGTIAATDTKRSIDENPRLFTDVDGYFFNYGTLNFESYKQLYTENSGFKISLSKDAKIRINDEDILGGMSGISFVGETSDVVAVLYLDRTPSLHIRKDVVVKGNLPISLLIDYNASANIDSFEYFSKKNDLFLDVSLNAKRVVVDGEVVLGATEENPAIVREESGSVYSNFSYYSDKCRLYGNLTINRNINNVPYHASSARGAIIKVNNADIKVEESPKILSKGLYAYDEDNQKWESVSSEIVITEFKLNQNPILNEIIDADVMPSTALYKLEIKIQGEDEVWKANKSGFVVNNEWFNEKDVLGKRLEIKIVPISNDYVSTKLAEGMEAVIITEPVAEIGEPSDSQYLYNQLMSEKAKTSVKEQEEMTLGNEFSNVTTLADLYLKGTLNLNTWMEVAGNIYQSGQGQLDLLENGKLSFMNISSEKFGRYYVDDVEMIGPNGSFMKVTGWEAKYDNSSLTIEKNSDGKIKYIVEGKGTIELKKALPENSIIVGRNHNSKLIIAEDNLYDSLPKGTYIWRSGEWIAAPVHIATLSDIAPGFVDSDYLILDLDGVATASDVISVPENKRLEINGDLDMGEHDLDLKGTMVMNGTLSVFDFSKIQKTRKSEIITNNVFKFKIKDELYLLINSGNSWFDFRNGTELKWGFANCNRIEFKKILDDVIYYVHDSNIYLKEEPIPEIEITAANVYYLENLIVKVGDETDKQENDNRLYTFGEDAMVHVSKNEAGKLIVTVPDQFDETSEIYFNGEKIVKPAIFEINEAGDGLNQI